jgi:hypothetical protein
MTATKTVSSCARTRRKTSRGSPTEKPLRRHWRSSRALAGTRLLSATRLIGIRTIYAMCSSGTNLNLEQLQRDAAMLAALRNRFVIPASANAEAAARDARVGV